MHSKKKPKDFFLLYNLLRFLQMNKTCQSMHLQRLLLAVNIDGTSQHYAHGRHHAVMLKIYQAWHTDVFLQHFPNSHPDPDHSATGQVSLPASFSPESCISVPSTDRHNKRSYRQKQEQEGLRGKFNWRWWWSDRESSTNLTLCYKKNFKNHSTSIKDLEVTLSKTFMTTKYWYFYTMTQTLTIKPWGHLGLARCVGSCTTHNTQAWYTNLQ